MKNQNYFPMALNVAGRACLVIGNDDEAYYKIARLIQAEATVTVIAPAFEERFQKYNVTFLKREFRLDDITDQFFVILCIKDNPDLTRRVADVCRAKRILLCAIDQPEYCDLVNVSFYERGPLKISVSTNGVAPAVSRKIRQGLEASLKDAPLEEYFSFLARLRTDLAKTEPDPAKRREKLIHAASEFEFHASVKLPKEYNS